MEQDDGLRMTYARFVVVQFHVLTDLRVPRRRLEGDLLLLGSLSGRYRFCSLGSHADRGFGFQFRHQFRDCSLESRYLRVTRRIALQDHREARTSDL